MNQTKAPCACGRVHQCDLERTERKYDTVKHAARLTVILDKWEEVIAVIRAEIPPAAETVPSL